MKQSNPKLLLKLWQIISSILMKELDSDFVLEFLQICCAVISLFAVFPTAGIIAGGVAIYCLLDKSKDDEPSSN